MSTPFKTLFDGVISKLRSTGLPGITEEQLDFMMTDFIRPACVKFTVCRQDLSNRNDLTQQFNITLTDEEIEILVLLMLIEYLSVNYINVPSLLKQSLTSKDFQTFSNANHLDKLMELREMYRRDARQMMSIYSNRSLSLFDSP